MQQEKLSGLQPKLSLFPECSFTFSWTIWTTKTFAKLRLRWAKAATFLSTDRTYCPGLDSNINQTKYWYACSQPVRSIEKILAAPHTSAWAFVCSEPLNPTKTKAWRVLVMEQHRKEAARQHTGFSEPYLLILVRLISSYLGDRAPNLRWYLRMKFRPMFDMWDLQQMIPWKTSPEHYEWNLSRNFRLSKNTMVSMEHWQKKSTHWEYRTMDHPAGLLQGLHLACLN